VGGCVGVCVRNPRSEARAGGLTEENAVTAQKTGWLGSLAAVGQKTLPLVADGGSGLDLVNLIPPICRRG
jgi:hypothetical protein